MAVAAPARPAAADLLGVFTPEVFAAHLASQAALPSWWLERKRSAYSRFESLPMPRRTDESWRFSNIAGIGKGPYSCVKCPKTFGHNTGNGNFNLVRRKNHGSQTNSGRLPRCHALPGGGGRGGADRFPEEGL